MESRTRTKEKEERKKEENFFFFFLSNRDESYRNGERYCIDRIFLPILKE